MVILKEEQTTFKYSSAYNKAEW